MLEYFINNWVLCFVLFPFRTSSNRPYCAQKETPAAIQLHLAAIHGDEILLRKLLDSGKVHVDCKDEVCVHVDYKEILEIRDTRE